MAIPWRHSKGGRFVMHAKALPGNPYDGHALRTLLPEIKRLTGKRLAQEYRYSCL